MKSQLIAAIAVAGATAAAVAAYRRGRTVVEGPASTTTPWTVFANKSGSRPTTDLALPETDVLAELSDNTAAPTTTSKAPAYNWPYRPVAIPMYRHSEDVQPVEIDTDFGVITLRPALGYYSGAALWVYFPGDIRYREDDKAYKVLELIARRFSMATYGMYHMQSSGHNSLGGNEQATFMISAGTNYDAYLDYHRARRDNPDNVNPEGTFGYFKLSPAPQIGYAADVLVRILRQLNLMVQTDAERVEGPKAIAP